MDSVFLVFEYCPHDMGKLVDSLPKPFHESEVKCLMQQVRGPGAVRAWQLVCLFRLDVCLTVAEQESKTRPFRVRQARSPQRVAAPV